MKLLLDMNISPGLVSSLAGTGLKAIHWSDVGSPGARDVEVFSWGRKHGCVIVTHDLDFGAILAATGEAGPSVVQFRTRDVSPGALLPLLRAALKRFSAELEAGAIVTVNVGRMKAQMLPLRPEQD